MRSLTEGMAAALDAGTTTLCLCWRLERADGAVFGATEHDRPLSFGGVDYEPARALISGAFESSTRLAPGTASAGGALDADFLQADHLEAGLWNKARVDVWRVDWTDAARRMRIWSGRIGEVSRSGEAFAAELVSLKADLERSIGRVYARACDAEVGDARCGVDLASDALRGEGEVASASGARIVAAGLGAFAQGWFRGGRLTWTSGANAGRTCRVTDHLAGASVALEIHPAPAAAPVAGDAFTVTAGCSKQFATCGTKFANTDNFRGFPHLPGNDVLFAGPEGGTADNGGRRA